MTLSTLGEDMRDGVTIYGELLWITQNTISGGAYLEYAL